MVAEDIREQLEDYKEQGKPLKYLINYLMESIEDDDIENVIIREMQTLGFKKNEVIECLEYDFSLDMS